MPPDTHRLVADIDATLVQQVFDVPQRRRETDVYHHGEADDLGAGLDVPERAAVGHGSRLSTRSRQLKRGSSDNAQVRRIASSASLPHFTRPPTALRTTKTVSFLERLDVSLSADARAVGCLLWQICQDRCGAATNDSNLPNSYRWALHVIRTARSEHWCPSPLELGRSSLNWTGVSDGPEASHGRGCAAAAA